MATKAWIVCSMHLAKGDQQIVVTMVNNGCCNKLIFHNKIIFITVLITGIEKCKAAVLNNDKIMFDYYSQGTHGNETEYLD